MRDQIDAWRRGEIALPTLSENLFGLLKASEMDASPVGEEFYSRWADLDSEVELRTEPWAPPGLASDERLEATLTSLLDLINQVLTDG
jgi:hypothetical protein